MNSLELFAGAGGLAMGTALAGFRHKAVIEFNHHACETIRINKREGHRLVKNWRVEQADVRMFDYATVEDSIDVVFGGPPCQPFSLGGKHRAHEDSRDMFPEAVRAIRELRPRAFLFENVKGLTRETFASYFSYIVLRLSYPLNQRKERETWEDHLRRLERQHTRGEAADLQYNVVWRVLNAADYGVPQRRERVFIVGLRSDIGKEWNFPEPTHSEDSLLYAQYVSKDYWDEHRVASKAVPELDSRLASRVTRLRDSLPVLPERWRTIRDATSDLPKPQVGRTLGWRNHALMNGAKLYPGHTGSSYDYPAKTLKAGVHGVPGGENIVMFPSGEFRYFTVRESARIQTFDDSYSFYGSWTESMRQIGNAVPVDLGKVVARSLKITIRE